jgi:glycosyltransferase involved in cell wall biosynthesis
METRLDQRPRRILVVSDATGYGGAERSIELLAPELARRARVLVLTSNRRHHENLERAAAGGDLRVAHLPGGEGPRSRGGRPVCVLLAAARLRPDALIANTCRSALAVSWALRHWPHLQRRTWIYVRDFMWPNLPEILGRLPRAGVLVPGPAVLERAGYLASWVEPMTRRRVRVVPDMVREVAGVREHAAHRGRYILHLATVNPWKGHAHLIRAAGRLRAEGRPLWIRSRGVSDESGLRRTLERQIAASGLAGAGQFELLEHAEDPSEELRGCRCVVVTSVSRAGGPETFGRSIIEAWAHGKPVVAFAAGGAKHLISHGDDGLLVPEGDEEALAEALWRLHAEPMLADRLGERGREKVARQYSLGKIAERLMTVLAER